VALAVLFRLFLRQHLVESALDQANRNIAGSMEGHAAMDMSVTGPGTFWRRLTSRKGFIAVSHIFVMEWAAIWRDIVAGLLITGALAAWVPMDFWKSFFLTDHPVLAGLWGPLVGPIVAVTSFVCSIGNVPLAAVLWNGGISFGGVVAFIFADLIILPILNIYRKYYGWKMAAFIAATFYVTMVLAGYAIELIFNLAHLVPVQRHVSVIEAHISWNYTTWLNITFLVLAAVLLARFVTSGGLPMLKMMDGSPNDAVHHDRYAGHDHSGPGAMRHAGHQDHERG
jgi:uncharacterized membrane protein YraQ (UPF0718 family)